MLFWRWRGHMRRDIGGLLDQSVTPSWQPAREWWPQAYSCKALNPANNLNNLKDFLRACRLESSLANILILLLLMLLICPLLVLKGQMLSLYHTFLGLLEREPSFAFFQDAHFDLDYSWVGNCTYPFTDWEGSEFCRGHRWWFLCWVWEKHCLMLLLAPFLPSPLAYFKIK